MKVEDYTVGWICALPGEQAAVVLDEYHDQLPAQRHDTIYVFGRIKVHNVVVACLPSIGTNAAARCAARLQFRFPAMRAIFMVGIGGGVPPRHDVRLGDVVVSVPGKTHRGVIQYDFGTQFQDESLLVRDTQLNRPSDFLLTAVHTLGARYMQSATVNELGQRIHDYAESIAESYPALKATRRPQADNLFRANYRHLDDQKTCEQAGCSKAEIIERSSREPANIPQVHYGLVASGNKVLRDALERDRLSTHHDILCFEMEAAGVINEAGYLVIRGICDYCDSHKNKDWQAYAAAVAAAYARELLGSIPPFQREAESFPMTNECLRSLCLTDPRIDKAEILYQKDELLLESCSWIYEDEAFRRWWDSDESPILWIHGDPGKGKTMLMIAMSEQISTRLTHTSDSTPVAYFFCQNTSPKANTAHAVLRGLIYMPVTLCPELLHHVEKGYNETGSRLFEGGSSDIFALRSILLDVIRDPNFSKAYLIVDALDECTSDLEALLDIITRDDLGLSSKAKWLLSSRNDPRVREKLDIGAGRLHTSLELNAEHISQGVKNFIKCKVDRLARSKRYEQELEIFVRSSLIEKAEDTYLWVSLVCKQLHQTMVWQTRDAITQFPTGLPALYGRMMEQIDSLADQEAANYCRRLLRAAVIASRPLSLEEIVFVAALPETKFKSLASVRELLSFCGSFLTCRENTVHFVHLSAKDYLEKSSILMSGKTVANQDAAQRCLELLLAELKEDMCNLKAPGTLLREVPVGTIELLVPPSVRYACCYWIEHLTQAALPSELQMIMHDFFCKVLLHWIESLSLLERVSEGVMGLLALDSFIQIYDNEANSAELRLRINDSFRFLTSNKRIIESAPLQVYLSALIFSPQSSITRQTYLTRTPANLVRLPEVDEEWSPCLHTLEGHTSMVHIVVFSPDGEKVASSSENGTIVVHDTVTGKSQLHLATDSELHITELAFTPHGMITARFGLSKTKTWDTVTGQLQSTSGYGGHNAFENKYLSSEQPFGDINFRLSPRGEIYAFGTECALFGADFASKSKRYSSNESSNISVIEVWDAVTTQLRWTLTHPAEVNMLEISPDDKKIALGDITGWITMLDAVTGKELLKFENHVGTNIRDQQIIAGKFSPDGSRIATGTRVGTIKLWDAVTGEPQSTLVWDSSTLISIAFSSDGSKFASASLISTIVIWDEATCRPQSIFKCHPHIPASLTFSPDGKKIISRGYSEGTIKILDATGVRNDSWPLGQGVLAHAVLAQDSKTIAFFWLDGGVELEDVNTGERTSTPETHSGLSTFLAFSQDASRLALGFASGKILICGRATGVLKLELTGHKDEITALCFLSNDELVSASADRTIKRWDTRNGQLLLTFQGFENRACETPRQRRRGLGQFLMSCASNTMSLVHISAFLKWTAIERLLQVILEVCTPDEQACQRERKGHVAEAEIWDLAICPNGVKIAFGLIKGSVLIWDVVTRQLCLTLPTDGERVEALAFSTDGEIIAVGYGFQVTLRKSGTGELVRTFDSYDGSSVISFSQHNGDFIWGRDHMTPGSRWSPASRSMLSQCYSLNKRRDWVLHNGEPFFWLPWDFRPAWDEDWYVIYDNVLIISRWDARKTVLQFQHNQCGKDKDRHGSDAVEIARNSKRKRIEEFE